MLCGPVLVGDAVHEPEFEFGCRLPAHNNAANSSTNTPAIATAVRGASRIRPSDVAAIQEMLM